MDKLFSDQLNAIVGSGTARANATKIALCILVLASTPALLFAAATMGNAVQLFHKYPAGRKYTKKQAQNAWKTARRQKLIEYVADKEGKTIIRITKKGESKLRTFAIDSMEIAKPAKWDGKWRLVMFDLPIRFSKARNALRYKLKKLGFVQFQKSVWIHPYPCQDELLFVADFFAVGKYVEVLEVSSITREEKLKKYFGLS